MDHAHIEAQRVVDRYLMGQLDDAERGRFEEHFVDCPTCMEQLETVEGLRAGLKDLPSGFSAAAPAPAATVPPGSSRPRARPFLTLLAAACLLMGAASSLFFYSEARRARQEVEAGRQTAEKALQLQAVAEQQLQRELATRTRPAPLAATVFTLNLTRAASASPSDRVVLPGSPGLMVLLFDRPDQPGVRGYRVRISGEGGGLVGEPVTASASAGGMLAVSVPSSLLAAGDYRLAVEDARSGAVLVTYRFRAASTP